MNLDDLVDLVDLDDFEYSKSEEKYFVGSNGDSPASIYFSYEDAVLGDDNYIDSFNSGGNHVNAYKRIDTNTYTTEF